MRQVIQKGIRNENKNEKENDVQTIPTGPLVREVAKIWSEKVPKTKGRAHKNDQSLKHRCGSRSKAQKNKKKNRNPGPEFQAAFVVAPKLIKTEGGGVLGLGVRFLGLVM